MALFLGALSLIALAIAKVYFTDEVGASATLQVILDAAFGHVEKGKLDELGYNGF